MLSCHFMRGVAQRACAKVRADESASAARRDDARRQARARDCRCRHCSDAAAALYIVMRYAAIVLLRDAAAIIRYRHTSRCR